METPNANPNLDRHALVMAIWLAFGLVAAALLHHGFGTGGALPTLAACGAVLAAFIGHVIVNAVYATTFTRRELILGLVIYGAMLVAFLLALLRSESFRDTHALPLGLGLAAIGAGVLFYMITHFGLRQVFDAFDVIRDARADRHEGSQP